MIKVVLDELIAAKAAAKTSGLVIGQRVADVLFVLDLVPFADGADVDVHCEHVERMLVGGLIVVGVYERDSSKDNGRALLWNVLGKRHLERGGMAVVALVILLGATSLKLVRFDLKAWSNKEEKVNFSTSNVLARMTLHNTRLSVKLGIAMTAETPAGSLLECAVAEFGDVIQKQVVVGALAKEKTSLWLQRSGPLTHLQPGFSVTLSGVIVGFAFVHADCSAVAGCTLLLEDLKRSLEVRVGVMLDELDAMQEEGSTPEVEHLLSRVKALADAPEQLRWTLPRRLLIRGGAIPVCDWGFAWEESGTWKRTVERCRQVLGLETESSDVDSSYESLKEGSFLELTGKKSLIKVDEKKPQIAKVEKSSNNSNVLVVLAVLLCLSFATLAWRTIFS
jgi:hypothetical protein